MNYLVMYFTKAFLRYTGINQPIKSSANMDTFPTDT